MAVRSQTYHFISTQGPLPNTVLDFWNTVWQHGVDVIAMLTDTVVCIIFLTNKFIL